jgi:hypothetical protein
MLYNGFEKDRITFKYICPIKLYGFECSDMSQYAHFSLRHNNLLKYLRCKRLIHGLSIHLYHFLQA